MWRIKSLIGVCGMNIGLLWKEPITPYSVTPFHVRNNHFLAIHPIYYTQMPFSRIINGITILDRNFLEMEAVKPIYAAIGLAGLHILRPFHKLIIDRESTYGTLMVAFPKLNNELLTFSPADMISLSQVFKFAADTHFNDALPNPELSSHLIAVAMQYEREVCQLLKILLKKFSYGFEYQKGAIFGFGDRKK